MTLKNTISVELLLLNTSSIIKCIHFQQTGFNEISAVTPFGLYVVRENFATSKRLGKFGQQWLNRYQNKLLLKNPRNVYDYSPAELRRLSIDSINEMTMRPRIGSTVSQMTYRYSEEDGLERTERRRQTLGAKDYQVNLLNSG